MTLWDTLFAFRRKWYIVLIGVACTALAFVAIGARPTVYFSRATVFFVAPASRENPNALQLRLNSLIVTAGVVAKRINGVEVATKVASMDATIVGRGIYDGTLVQLPDNGGQWSANYNSQALDVQVAAPTPELVRERQVMLVAKISETLEALQDELKVPPVDRITIESAPGAPPIDAMRGESRRARVMTLALGGLFTLVAVYASEVLGRRRARRAHPDSDAVARGSVRR